jgi:acyl transferase domain-containing protein
MGSLDYSTQDATGVPPIAVVSFACRLPGGNNDPETLWRFLENGKTAPNTVPESRFASCGHYDGSKRSKTMKGRGGMFLGDVDLARFDAPFFNISAVEARAAAVARSRLRESREWRTHPRRDQRTASGLLRQQLHGWYVASLASIYHRTGTVQGLTRADYLAIQNRDPDARPRNMTTGTKRSILSNRISYYFNLKGPR